MSGHALGARWRCSARASWTCSDAGLEHLGQVLDFLARTHPAAALRLKEKLT